MSAEPVLDTKCLKEIASDGHRLPAKTSRRLARRVLNQNKQIADLEMQLAIQAALLRKAEGL